MTQPNQLDLKGLSCPLPLLKLKQQLNHMQVGDEIRVFTTDPGSVRDFAAFIAQVGHELLDHRVTESQFEFLIRKTA